MTIDLTTPPRPRLPVWAVVTRSYSYVWEHRSLFAIPVAMLCLAQVAAGILLRSPHLHTGGHPTGGEILGAVVGFVAKLAIAMAFAVGVHRTVLLNEDRAGIGFFRWDSGLWRYFGATLMIFLVTIGYLLVIALIAFLCAFVAGMARKLVGGGGGTVIALASVLAGIAGYLMVTARFLTVSLALPAAALGADQSMATAWRTGGGNGWRLFAAMILACVPFVVAGVIVEAPYLINVIAASMAEPHAPPPPPGLGTLIANGLVTGLSTPILITVLSLSYDVLARGGGPRD